MKKTSNVLLNILFGLLFLTACSSAGETAMPATTATPQPAAPIKTAVPTAFSRADSMIWHDLQVTMSQSELTEDFITEFGTTRIPSAGEKFAWVHVQLKNTGQDQIDVPLPEHFSLLYAATELKPTYGHRKDHVDYFALDPVIFPNQEVDAWLRFDVPVAAELRDLRFIFLPESSQVGVSFPSPNYPYAEDHPTYVWSCEP